MALLLIAIGNPLRRDDGVARRVIELLRPLPPGVSAREVQQLTPELAEEIASFAEVVFLDALVTAGGCASSDVRLDEILQRRTRRPGALAHQVAPQEIVELSRRLYGFGGRAWLCAIPGMDFSAGEGLSEVAENMARAAALKLRALLSER